MTGLFRLPPLPDEFDEYTAQTVLPEFTPRFFVPPMLDKPQNPIMDTLKLRAPIAPVPTPLRLALATELAPLMRIQTVPKLNDSIWTDAVKTGFARSEILSWDALRPNYSGHPVPNPFISEQDKLVFAAARYYVQPRLNDPGIEVKYVTQHELLTALKMTVLGTSSPLHTWDPVSETFVQIVAEKGTRGILLVDDKDEVVSKSWISGFLTIGTLMRRLEILLASLGSRFAKEGPTIHAFTHALSTILSFVRESLARCSPREGQLSITLSAVWNEYEPYQDILVSLAALCGRAEQKSPRDYVMLDPAPINLLSLLYDHLHSHMEQQSPTMVTAVSAFILTSASREYFQQLSRSVGFGGDSSVKKPARVVGEQDQYALDVSDDGIEERPDEVDSIIDSFPTFFPPNVVNVLPAAQKSLILLRAAEPDHPLLRAPPAHCIVQWFWAWDEVEAAWNHRDERPAPKQPARRLEDSPVDGNEPGLAQFRIFDLEPGGHFGHTLLDDKHTPTPISALQNFIDTFPKSLHPITPTLSHLTSLVFERLVQHASTLSSTLLSLFMSPAAPLQFRPHMELLHSYLLLAAPSFRSRLAAALFSDSQGYDADEAIPVSVRTIGARRKAPEKRDRVHRWPVGLSFALLERETWPPVGADLSFFLRTVIVDSFEVPAERRLAEAEGDGAPSIRETFWVEAERRLGFAIRDLPTGPGHDQWLNPLSIEALDFLYMDYKPPHPLDILITPEILSKYQRMFTYLLRIIRVEHALAAVFRMCRPAARPLFPTFTPSNKLLLHFRFIAHAFVSTLSEYILDTAIGGNFDPFLASLSLSQPAYDGHSLGFSDVFALAKAHSALMDDVLSACLLRSSQRAAGDLLRQALELVLEFAVLVGERKTGRLEEYEAAPRLGDLAGRFRAKMRAVTKALKALLDKEPVLGGEGLGGSSAQGPGQGQGRRPTGGVRAIAHLCESLSEWWSS
ncbi:gamma-tubulin complex, DGRIP91/SPC98 component protein [Mycena albidolilacea]|uniref:Spindle pole body component n=1 Tax=Mycena albidolilacea TaxID=1033008 RepID=A0AAD7A9W5_9AGAR|nr:gamma-tubulin complex, DGRIP91/SPC98 component protein [Mycena albidolilacea]